MPHLSTLLFNLCLLLVFLLFSDPAKGLAYNADSPEENKGTTETELPPYMSSFNTDSISDIARLIDGRRAVLLGEASHGTSEYYTIRAELSKELIEHHGYHFIVVEGDWDAAWKVNQYVKQLDGAPETAEQALASFTRWPPWMWNNEEVLALVKWMRDWNDALPDGAVKVGFYGMDVYGYEGSVRILRNQVELLETEARRAVQVATHCMSQFRGDRRGYLENTQLTGEHCGSDITKAVQELTRSTRPDELSEEEWFNIQQHARVIKQADLHLRGMLQQGPSSWNERATNFKNTLTHLLEFYGEEGRGIAWAHNTHIGDARATDMASAGMHNIGQLARVAYGEENVFALGFGTYKGSVKAGSEWEGRMQRMDTPAATRGSLEAELYSRDGEPLWMNLNDATAQADYAQRIPHRAIGVVYNPANDAQQNYVGTDLAERYNAFIFIPYTNAVSALGE